MRRYRLLVAVLWQWLTLLGFALPGLVLPDLAYANPAQAAPTHIAAELLTEGAAAPGSTVTLAIHMRPDKGWHGYWLNPGDAGLGMTFKWTLPPGVTAGEPRYPVPQVLLISGLMNHVYESDYAVLVPLTLPRDAAPGTSLPVALEADWLACTDEICVPERAHLNATVTVAPATANTPAAPDPRFDAWRARLPAPLGTQAHFVLAGNTIRLGIPLPGSLHLDAPHFFPAEDRAIAYAAPQTFSRKGDLLIVEMQRPRIAPAEPQRIAGVLSLNAMGDGLEIDAVPGAVPAGGEPLAEGTVLKAASLPLLLLGAVIGGLLLNIMPCVFPILSLKALSLARAGESETHAREEGLAYAAGVIAACAGLGALLLALRAAGEEVGWAFQLQEPGVVAALLLLATGITANFLGLFEFAVPGFAREGSIQGAFATGLLAAFAATPCTGPFMATAMGAALLLPVLPAMALFAALGLGIALPFLAVAFVPALRSRLPRPGAWMVRFRHWMALPMALTALALAWLASRLGGLHFALACGLLAALLVLVLALAGRRQRTGQSATGIAVPGLLAIAIAGFAVLPRIATTPEAAAEGLLPAQPFSEAALAEARRSGKPIFAWFTADWCITCKVNEEVAIERETVRDAFARAGVIVLRGDWTRRDPDITRYLTAQGAAGVPLYVWYPADGGAPRRLPQVLAPGSLEDLVAP